MTFHQWRMRSALLAYHDGELAPARRLQVSRHLDACEACRLEVEALQHDERLLSAGRVDADGLETDAARAMFRSVMAEAAPVIAARRRFSPAWGLAALAGIAAAAGLLLPHHAGTPVSVTGPSISHNKVPSAPEHSDPAVVAVVPDALAVLPHRGRHHTRKHHTLLAMAPATGVRKVFAAEQWLRPAETEPEIVPLEPDTDERGLRVGEVYVHLVQPKLTATVREGAEDETGFARASAVGVDESGLLVRAQCTISTEKRGAELVFTPITLQLSVP